MTPVLTTIKPGLWKVKEEFTWRHITIPVGFVCDLDSVPRLPWVYWRFKERTVTAALVHDYLYYRQTCSRLLADALFYQAMVDEGVPIYYRTMIHAAVRWFGWWAWWRNQ